MTVDAQIVQTRLSGSDVERLDRDAELLGLATRSDALREGLRLLHRQARYAALSSSYDEFYGVGNEAPISELAAAGDQIAAEVMAAED